MVKKMSEVKPIMTLEFGSNAFNCNYKAHQINELSSDDCIDDFEEMIQSMLLQLRTIKRVGEVYSFHPKI